MSQVLNENVVALLKGEKGEKGNTGDTGEKGEQALALMVLFRDKVVKGSTYNYNISNFNRPPMDDETFTFHTADSHMGIGRILNASQWICEDIISTQGDAGLSLTLKSFVEATPSKNYQAWFDYSNFNREPVVGDICFASFKNGGRSWLATGEITDVQNVSSAQARLLVNDYVETTGAQGPQGNDGADGTNGRDGTNGANGADGKDGADALVMTRFINAGTGEIVVGGTYNYTPSEFNREPVAGNTFTFHTTSNQEGTGTIISTTTRQWSCGQVLDRTPLSLVVAISDTTDPSDHCTIDNGNFNRTPNEGDVFKGMWKNTREGKSFVISCAVRDVSSSNAECIILNTVETTGAQGGKGDTGDNGADGKPCYIANQVQAKTPTVSTDMTIDGGLTPSNYSVGDNVLFTCSLSSKSYVCFGIVKTVASSPTVTIKSVIDTTGAKGDKGESAENVSSALALNVILEMEGGGRVVYADPRGRIETLDISPSRAIQFEALGPVFSIISSIDRVNITVTADPEGLNGLIFSDNQCVPINNKSVEILAEYFSFMFGLASARQATLNISITNA